MQSGTTLDTSRLVSLSTVALGLVVCANVTLAGSMSVIPETRDCFRHVGDVREKFLSLDTHLLSESAHRYLLLNLREDEGQEEVLEDKNEEEEESEVDEKVKEVRENAQLMHATW